MRDTLRARADALRSLGPRGMIPCAIWPRPRASAPHGRNTKRGLTPTRCSRLATWRAPAVANALCGRGEQQRATTSNAVSWEAIDARIYQHWEKQRDVVV